MKIGEVDKAAIKRIPDFGWLNCGLVYFEFLFWMKNGFGFQYVNAQETQIYSADSLQVKGQMP